MSEKMVSTLCSNVKADILHRLVVISLDRPFPYKVNSLRNALPHVTALYMHVSDGIAERIRKLKANA